jgi:AraC family transcriptional regulator, ethanolamine operon transcriptional activator
VSSVSVTVGDSAIYGMEFENCISVGPAMSMEPGGEGWYDSPAEADVVKSVLERNCREHLHGFCVFHRISNVPEKFQQKGETPINRTRVEPPRFGFQAMRVASRESAAGDGAKFFLAGLPKALCATSGRVVFSDFDEFADSIRGIAGRFVPTARSESEWWLEECALGRLELQQLQIGGASTFAGVGTPDTLTLGIPMTDPKRIRIDGYALEDNSYIFPRRDLPFTVATRQATRWAGVTIPLRDEMWQGMFDAERIMTSVPGTRAQARLECLDRLRQLITRFNSQDAKIAILDPAAGTSAAQDMLDAMLRTIESSSAPGVQHVERSHISRSRVIGNAIALMEARQGEPLYVDDLCRATSVSERTLRNVFHEYFGVGPMRLLKARQLLEIRNALLAADPAHDTVAKIAASFGIWDFDLFARNYKALYGESPSETLRKPSPKSAGAVGVSWVAHVARQFPARSIPFDPSAWA